jgi:hypothetical protein
MSFFQGGALPNITETQTTKDQTPGWYSDMANKLSTTGQGFLNKTPDQLVAGYDPLQTQGYAKTEEAAGAYKPGLTNATTTANAAAAGITPERLQQLMNPYTASVVQELARQSGNALQRNILPQITGGFVGSGALGSSRYAGALGQAMTDVSANLAGEQGKLLSSGYENAVKNLLQEQQNMTQAGKLQGELAAQEQALGLTGAGALRTAGAERQKYEQQKLEAPLTTASNVAGLLRGYTIPTDRTQTTVKPGQQGQYGKSTFDQIGTLASLLGGATGTGQIPGYTQAQSNALRSLVGKGIDYASGFFNPTVNPGGGYVSVLPNNGGNVGDVDNWDLQIASGGAGNEAPAGGDYGSGAVYDADGNLIE